MSDLISRQAVLREFTCLSDDAFVINSTIQKIVKNLPSVELERKSGIWTHEDAGVWICGVCGEDVGEMGDEYGVPKYNFCPYCGADMTGRKWTDDRAGNQR